MRERVKERKGKRKRERKREGEKKRVVWERVERGLMKGKEGAMRREVP